MLPPALRGDDAEATAQERAAGREPRKSAAALMRGHGGSGPAGLSPSKVLTLRPEKSPRVYVRAPGPSLCSVFRLAQGAHLQF